MMRVAMNPLLSGRMLPFDRTAAETAAAIAARQRQIGGPIEIRDVRIAGIAAARKASGPRTTPVTSKTLAPVSSISL
jgi:hypothetical protein